MGDRMVVRQSREKNKDFCPTPERHSIRAMPAVTCLTEIMQREYRLEFCHLDFPLEGHVFLEAFTMQRHAVAATHLLETLTYLKLVVQTCILLITIVCI